MNSSSCYYDTVNGIVNVFSGIGEKFKTIGSNIVQGIWNGISAGWDWLKDKVKNLASSLLDAAKDALGIEDTEDYEDKKSMWERVEARSDIPMIRTTIAWICGGGVFEADTPEKGRYDSYSGKYSPGAYEAGNLAEMYEFLKEIGYVMSDMEIQLMDGTHECYGVET